MARNYNLHVLTLAQVATLLRVDGSWPGPIALSSGWYRARARPWNEAVPDPMIRLERGGSDFLGVVGRHLQELGAAAIYSPALYPGSTRVWRRAGFEDFATLDVMERSLAAGATAPISDQVRLERRPDWDAILEVDREAFDGFWGMSLLGLMEAHETNRSTAAIVAIGDRGISGYAIVGTQWGTVYLHRIAVRPDETGRGIGTALVTATINWGARTGTTMVLNVRPQNSRAKSLYRRLGFSDTGTALQVLRHDFA